MLFSTNNAFKNAKHGQTGTRVTGSYNTKSVPRRNPVGIARSDAISQMCNKTWVMDSGPFMWKTSIDAAACRHRFGQRIIVLCFSNAFAKLIREFIILALIEEGLNWKNHSPGSHKKAGKSFQLSDKTFFTELTVNEWDYSLNFNSFATWKRVFSNDHR